jgi:hypothetical protein
VSGESGELYKAPPSPWRLMGRSQKNTHKKITVRRPKRPTDSTGAAGVLALQWDTCSCCRVGPTTGRARSRFANPDARYGT